MKNQSVTGIATLAALLAVFWLINSGYFKPLLLGFGALSLLFVIYVSLAMKKQDQEFFPSIMPSLRLPGYLLWMIGEIVKANIDVMIRIIKGPSSISPVIIQVKAGQKSEVARVLYANSITMTPGTITLRIDDDTLEVHALTREAAESLSQGEMDRRVSRLEAV